MFWIEELPPGRSWRHVQTGMHLVAGSGRVWPTGGSVARERDARERYRDVLDLDSAIYQHLGWKHRMASWHVKVENHEEDSGSTIGAAVASVIERSADGALGLNLGFFLASEIEGMGLMSVMAPLVLAYALEHSHSQPEFVSVTTRATNTRAVSVARKLGLSPNPAGTFVAELADGSVKYSGFQGSLQDIVNASKPWLAEQVRESDLEDLMELVEGGDEDRVGRRLRQSIF
jgi:RimJ/RimL family protein N-acetyltransferase